MAGFLCVPTGVTIGRAIAAADLAALQADAQMQPATASGKTILATINRDRQPRDSDMIEMRARGHDLHQTRR